jgi:dTDP-6-deoxy-L-talose 4-dehydrogenase (NAD+)
MLLTGATGFVGRNVMKALREGGAPVRAVVRDGSASRLPSLGPDDSMITTADLFAETAAWWEQACKGVDTIVHVAWYAEPGKYPLSPKNLDCLAGTLAIAKGAVAAGVRRFVGVGTCAEYDGSHGYLAVTTPLAPATPYAAAKAAAFLALSRYFEQAKVEFAWCRLFYMYGEEEDSRRLVPHIRAKLSAGQPADLTSGTQVRDFMDVADAGRMIAETALSDHQGPLNVCSGVPITVRELAERVADEYGRRDLLRFGAIPDRAGEPPVVVGVRSQ